MRIGFAKVDITPPVGTGLGGYAGFRPCSGAHDPLCCKAVVLEQEGIRYGLITLDLMCVDEAMYRRLAEKVALLGIAPERLIACAIHSHAAPAGMVAGEGPLASINEPEIPKDPGFGAYIHGVIHAAAEACAQAAATMEPFQVRTARGKTPPVGSERHTGAPAGGDLTVVQCRTESGKVLTLYDFPCHPTVLSAANLQASADFVSDIEELLGGDMAVFLNGAAGDISTRYTRKEASFEECARMGRIAAEGVRSALAGTFFREPEPVRGIHTLVTLRAREVDMPEEAEKKLAEHTAKWKAAEAAGEDPATVRILKSYVEGAGVSLQFARTMAQIRQLCLPVTVFRFCGVDFASVPGELFSALQPEGLSVIGYANGYYRYLCPEAAYESGCYEAMAAIIRRGEAEVLIQEIQKLRQQLDK